MTYLHTLSLTLLLLCISQVKAETLRIKSSGLHTPVLELYTSEGCSSCPPAEHWLSELIKIPSQELNVLVLAFHVDYWDYIGWKDRFASPQFTDRQRNLARRNHQASIYTPAIFIDGMESRATRRSIEKIRQASQNPNPLNLELVLDKQANIFNLQLNVQNLPDQQMSVEFILYEDDLSSQVDRGENAGNKLIHQRVVRYLSPELRMDKQLHHQIRVDPQWKTQHMGIAALIKSGDHTYLQSIHSKI